jgi:hypothetical protein
MIVARRNLKLAEEKKEMRGEVRRVGIVSFF